MKIHKRIGVLVLLALLAAADTQAVERQADGKPTGWRSFISASEVRKRSSDPNIVIIDVRSRDEYQNGHLPGAINLPGSKWRTPKAAPGEGESQYIFRDASGKPDVARYEKFLGSAGVRPEHEIIVYGNHAGKTDGSVPAMILTWLGHKKLRFLDGVGVNEWKQAGFSESFRRATLPAALYKASPIAAYVWNLNEVLQNQNNSSVVFYDTRSPEEFRGEELRGNRRGGHLPGAVLLDYADFLDPQTKRVLPRADLAALLLKRGITPEKRIVLYCQTSTRVSLPALVLKDLGYSKVSVYDASWHEYGNRNDTPIAR